MRDFAHTHLTTRRGIGGRLTPAFANEPIIDNDADADRFVAQLVARWNACADALDASGNPYEVERILSNAVNCGAGPLTTAEVNETLDLSGKGLLP